MDGNTSQKSDCTLFDRGHIMQLDQSMTTPSLTVYSCPCGALQEVNEDSGTGA